MSNYPHTLLYKWLIGNSFAALFVYTTWLQGWIELTIRSDASYMSVAMAVVFLIFWTISSAQVILLDREFARFASADPKGVAAEYFEKLRRKFKAWGQAALDQSTLASTLRIRLMAPVHVVGTVSNFLVLIGLIGTVVGFVIAVSGLGDSVVQADNIERVKSALGQIINGMGVALFTTLVGSILGGLWLQVHYHLLSRGVTTLVVEIVEHAELEFLPALAGKAPAESGVPAPPARRGIAGSAAREPA